MIGSLVATALKMVAVLVVVLALAVLVLVLRVSYGALPLDMLTPVIEDALSASDGSYRVHMRSAELALADKVIDLVEPSIKARNPIPRVGEAGELKGVAVFLASDASSYITGQFIAVDGGGTVV